MPLGRLHLEPVVLQALIDLVHPLFALLHKTNMKVVGVLDFHGPTGLNQGEHQSIVVEEKGDTLISPLTPQPEILFQEFCSL